MKISNFLKMNSIDQIQYYENSTEKYDPTHYLYYVHNSVATMMYDINLDPRLYKLVRNVWKIQRAELINSGIERSRHRNMSSNTDVLVFCYSINLN